MKIKLMKGVLAVLLTIVLTGAVAGFINGFIGAGGGIVLLYLFKHINPAKDKESGRDNFAMVVATVLLLHYPPSIGSHGSVDPQMMALFIFRRLRAA